MYQELWSHSLCFVVWYWMILPICWVLLHWHRGNVFLTLCQWSNPEEHEQMNYMHPPCISWIKPCYLYWLLTPIDIYSYWQIRGDFISDMTWASWLLQSWVIQLFFQQQQWEHQRPVSLSLSEGNLPFTGGFPSQRAGTQITKFMGPTWGPPGSCWPQMDPMLAPWTLLSG